ncbi:MAG: carboxypeptidase-like regulatory domain-containing protein [Bacteroidota bacterium]
MKTRSELTTKLWNHKTLTLFVVMLMAAFTTQSFGQQYYVENAPGDTNQKASAQDLIVKGIVSDEYGALPDANVLLKGSAIGIKTDANGEFTFPQALKPGDVLVFSFLGYQTEEVEITSSTTFIRLMMVEEGLEILESLQTNQPYKSKRSKKD